jgi:hypothetical protein
VNFNATLDAGGLLVSENGWSPPAPTTAAGPWTATTRISSYPSSPPRTTSTHRWTTEAPANPRALGELCSQSVRAGSLVITLRCSASLRCARRFERPDPSVHPAPASGPAPDRWRSNGAVRWDRGLHPSVRTSSPTLRSGTRPVRGSDRG